MSKRKILVTAAVVFVLLNILPLPRGPLPHCEPSAPYWANVQLYGFPFTYIQRSISPSSCDWDSAAQQDFFSQHHVYPLKVFFNLAIGVILIAGLGYWLTRQGKRHG